MKKTFSLLLAVFLFACSSDSDNEKEILRAEQYGIYVKSKSNEPLTFSYKFYDYNGGSGKGEIYYQGEKTINEPTFILTNLPSDTNLENAVIEITLDEKDLDSFAGYWFSIQGDYYLLSNNLEEINTEAQNIFEVNKVNYVSNPNGTDYFEAVVYFDNRYNNYEWVDKDTWKPY